MNPLCLKIFYLSIFSVVTFTIISCSRDEVITSPLSVQLPCTNNINSNGMCDENETTPTVNDLDQDGITDETDNCVEISNPDQIDSDNDGKGDICDPADVPEDIDPDGVEDIADNYPEIVNPDQLDLDNDGKTTIDPIICPPNNLPDLVPVDSGYFKGAKLNISKTPSPSGNPVAISAHNSYVADSNNNSTQNFTSTISKINSNIESGADLIELDVVENSGNIYVQHKDDGTYGALLEDVLKDCALKVSNQPLFIEIKETTISNEFAEKLLSALVTSGYAKEVRPLYLRTFHNKREHLLKIKTLLNTDVYIAYKPYVFLHELFDKDNKSTVTNVQDWINTAVEDKIQGVEFRYNIKNLFAMINYAKEKGLGVGIFTIGETTNKEKFGEVFVASMREKVDQMTIENSDYPINKAKIVVSEKNGLLLTDTWNTNAICGATIANTTHQTSPKGEDIYGGYLKFDETAKNYVSYTDLDQIQYNTNYSNIGYFVSVLVNFDDLTLEKGKTMAILNKAQSGGFALEINKPNSESYTDSVLRFGVYVNGAYHYATYPLNKLNMTDSYLITGSYDGDSKVRMWVNNDSTDVIESKNITGSVVKNSVPITLGADPEANGSTRYYFSGKIQFAQVLSWQNH